MNEKTIQLGRKLYSFESFDDWCNTAQRKAKADEKQGHALWEKIYVDAQNRICAVGSHFMTARDEKAFPVDVYLIR